MKLLRLQDRRLHRRAAQRRRPRVARAVMLMALAFGVVAGCDSAGPGATGEGGSEAGRDSRPDLVVLLLDTLRPDHLPVYGYERDTAPFLSELAEAGVRFPNAFSTSTWTAPATASVFTGLYPPRHGVLEGMVAQRASTDTERESLNEIELSAMPAALPTLPERLRGAGYRSFGVAANINIGAALGFSRGFDRFDTLVDRPADALVDRLLEWRGEIEASAPFFVYAHFNDVHEPYDARSPWIEEFRASLSPHAGERAHVKARYDSEIAFLDAELRRLVERFEWRSAERERDLVMIVLS